MRNFITGLLSVAIMTFVSTGMVQAQDMYNQNTQNQNQGDDVVDVIQSSNEHTIFASLLEEADKVEELRNEDSVTVIAPTDEAFRDMDGEISDLRENPSELDNFLENHIENGDEMRANNNNNNNNNWNRENKEDKRDKSNKEVMKAENGEVHSVDKVKKDKNKKHKKDNQ